MIAGIELGGTKTVIGIRHGGSLVDAEIRIPTTTPEETMHIACEWLHQQCGAAGPQAIGIAAFGPIRVDPQAVDYGTFLTTPKLAWRGFSLTESLRKKFPDIRIALDTDVNAALLGEMRHGVAQNTKDAVYLTIGTGIGAGVCVNGALVHGMIHPEMGHIRVPRHPDDTFAGVCPYHGDCWEGLASGPAIAQRWGNEGRDLPENHVAWDMEAWYLAQGVLTAIGVLSPACVILGGGVPQAPGLLEKTACQLEILSNGYFESPGKIIHLPALGQQAGIIGALELVANDF